MRVCVLILLNLLSSSLGRPLRLRFREVFLWETLWTARGLRIRLERRVEGAGCVCAVSLEGDCEHLWVHARHRHGDVSVTERGG